MSYKRGGPKQEQKERGQIGPVTASSYWARSIAEGSRTETDVVKNAAVRLKSLHAARSSRSVMDLQFLAATSVESQPAVLLLPLVLAGAGRDVRLRSQCCHESCSWCHTRVTSFMHCKTIIQPYSSSHDVSL
jgi:hypothetical protein